LIHAEVSVYPMGTNTTSASFYIAKGIEAIKNLEGLRYEVNPMGTLLESENVDKIFEASKRITEAIHNLGVQRVEVVLKIDSRKDKDSKLEEKMESLKLPTVDYWNLLTKDCKLRTWSAILVGIIAYPVVLFIVLIILFCETFKWILFKD